MRPTVHAAALATLAAVTLATVPMAGCRALPTSAVAVENSAAWYEERGDYATASEEYRRAMDLSPGRLTARLGLGRTLLKLDRPREAMKHLEIARGVSPENTQVLDLLGEAMVRSGELAEMYKLYRGRADQRNTVEDWLRLGRLASMAGDADVAERALLTAARLDRGQTPAPQLALADFYESIGDEHRALERLRMTLTLTPADESLHTRIRAMGHTPGPTFALPPQESLPR